MALRGLAGRICLMFWLVSGAAAGTGAAQEQNPLAVQEALIWSDLYSGPLDGNFGPGTLAAIRKFQGDIHHPATGVLTPDEWMTLFSQAGRVRSAVGFTEIEDANTGIRVGLPMALVHQRTNTPSGSDYVSSAGDLFIGLQVYRVQNDPTADFNSLLSALRNSNVEYKVQREGWFVITGSTADKKYYIRLHSQQGFYAGFYATYDLREASRFGAAVNMASFTLDPFAAESRLSTSRPLSSLLGESRLSALLPNSETVQRDEISRSVAIRPPERKGNDATVGSKSGLTPDGSNAA